MKISLFSTIRDNDPKAKEYPTFADFVNDFGVHNYSRTSKLLLPAWSPAEFRGSRAIENVVAVHALVFDFDGLTEEQALEAIEKVQRYSSLVHTSWSHAEKPWRLRAIVELQQPVLAADWPAFWDAANAHFGGLADTNCRDAARAYYGAYAPPGTEDRNFLHVFEGPPFRLTAQTPEPKKRLTKIPKKRVVAFAKQLSRKSDDYLANLGDILQKALAGEPFAEPGARDDTIFRLSTVLARRFPTAEPDDLATHFADSLAQMGPDCPTVADVAYKLRRHQETPPEEGRTRIQEAFTNGRTEAYTKEELDTFGDVYWIVQRGNSYYFFLNGTYVGPYTHHDAANAALRDLAPAASAGVTLFRTTAQGGLTRMPMAELIAKHGTVARHVQLDLRAQTTTYDGKTHTLIEACCPKRKLEPLYTPEIATWLQIMAHDRHEKLLSWLAAVTLLDRPCVILFLTGAPGVGKSFLAHGTARIWTLAHPTPLEDLFGVFNASVARCPLVFGDERIPKDFRGYAKTDELRQAVQATVRQYNAKYLPPSTLHGAVRIIVAANNENILSTSENLGVDDIGAIIDRYLHVPAHPDAAKYLAEQDTAGWLEQDLIARHVLWLAENHEWTPRGRFLIEAQDEQLHRDLVTRSGSRGAVCQWLVRFLLEPQVYTNDARGKGFVRVHNQRLCVNVQGVVACWGLYVQNEPCATTSRLSTAIASLSTGQRVRLAADDGPRINYYVIDVENLVAWAERTGYADRERIEKALG